MMNIHNRMGSNNNQPPRGKVSPSTQVVIQEQENNNQHEDTTYVQYVHYVINSLSSSQQHSKIFTIQ